MSVWLIGIVLFFGLNIIYIVNEIISLIQHKQVLQFLESKYPLLFLFPIVVVRIMTVFKLLLFRENVYDSVFAIVLILKWYKAETVVCLLQ